MGWSDDAKVNDAYKNSKVKQRSKSKFCVDKDNGRLKVMLENWENVQSLMNNKTSEHFELQNKI